MITQKILEEKYRVDPSWSALIENLLNNPEVEELKRVLGRDKHALCPKQEDMFNAFSMSIEEIKCVIIGQDPYIQKGQALGYSFAIPEEFKLTPSLQIISKELERCGYKSLKEGDRRTLKSWSNQGVLLLNRALTTRLGLSNAHAKQWKYFTDAIISELTKIPNIVYMLWGNNAKEVKSLLRDDHILVLEACHPIAERYSGGKKKFIGCDHFMLANQYLQNSGRITIDW